MVITTLLIITLRCLSLKISVWYVKNTCNKYFEVILQILFFFKIKIKKKTYNLEKAGQKEFQTYRKIKLQFWMNFKA